MYKPQTKLFGMLTLGSGVVMLIAEFMSLQASLAISILGCMVFGCCTLAAAVFED